MWGRTVGYIYWDKARKRGVFQYDDAYVKDGLDVAPFTMSLASEVRKEWCGMVNRTSCIKVCQP